MSYRSPPPHKDRAYREHSRPTEEGEYVRSVRDHRDNGKDRRPRERDGRGSRSRSRSPRRREGREKERDRVRERYDDGRRGYDKRDESDKYKSRERDHRDNKDRDRRGDSRAPRDSKDPRESKDPRDIKDGKDTRPSRERDDEDVRIQRDTNYNKNDESFNNAKLSLRDEKNRDARKERSYDPNPNNEPILPTGPRTNLKGQQPPSGPRLKPSSHQQGYGMYEYENEKPLDRKAIEEGRRRREEERARGVVYTEEKVLEDTSSGSKDVKMREKDGDGEGEEDEEGEEEEDISAMMGFGGFGTTKGKGFGVNADGAVKVNKQRTWRQYMNRRGGFNRPLDRIK
ncbi:hypothetical protein M231_04741 [Tremella mesenterica]|uniref:U4/U6.U5 small nuclear ribonucleoprotein 27kDa protein domain-containing protein n=1 Tax=Tremella mesenterica TaxID=5217 RepID=A0A4Q1BJV8_TREME|nr:hypothetical protein M231_04741 [Tremella mesenterica]